MENVDREGHAQRGDDDVRRQGEDGVCREVHPEAKECCPFLWDARGVDGGPPAHWEPACCYKAVTWRVLASSSLCPLPPHPTWHAAHAFQSDSWIFKDITCTGHGSGEGWRAGQRLKGPEKGKRLLSTHYLFKFKTFKTASLCAILNRRV